MTQFFIARSQSFPGFYVLLVKGHQAGDNDLHGTFCCSVQELIDQLPNGAHVEVIP